MDGNSFPAISDVDFNHPQLEGWLSTAPLGCHSRGTFRILSRNPSFLKTFRNPGKMTIGFCKERWLKRMDEETTPIDKC